MESTQSIEIKPYEGKIEDAFQAYTKTILPKLNIPTTEKQIKQFRSGQDIDEFSKEVSELGLDGALDGLDMVLAGVGRVKLDRKEYCRRTELESTLFFDMLKTLSTKLEGSYELTEKDVLETIADTYGGTKDKQDAFLFGYQSNVQLLLSGHKIFNADEKAKLAVNVLSKTMKIMIETFFHQEIIPKITDLKKELFELNKYGA